MPKPAFVIAVWFLVILAMTAVVMSSAILVVYDQDKYDKSYENLFRLLLNNLYYGAAPVVSLAHWVLAIKYLTLALKLHMVFKNLAEPELSRHKLKIKIFHWGSNILFFCLILSAELSA